MNETVLVERHVDANNQIWHRKTGEGLEIGFTNAFLGTVREAWHVVPATNKTKEKAPLLAIETNDALFTIPSPMTGVVTFFNKKATDFPDQLTEDDVICAIGEATKAKKEEEAVWVDEMREADREVRVGGNAVNRVLEQMAANNAAAARAPRPQFNINWDAVAQEMPIPAAPAPRGRNR